MVYKYAIYPLRLLFFLSTQLSQIRSITHIQVGQFIPWYIPVFTTRWQTPCNPDHGIYHSHSQYIVTAIKDKHRNAFEIVHMKIFGIIVYFVMHLLLTIRPLLTTQGCLDTFIHINTCHFSLINLFIFF